MNLCFLPVLLPQVETLSMDGMITGVLTLFVLLLLSALFSGSEVALFSLDTTQRDDLAEADDKSSKRVFRLLSQPRSVLVTILILNTVVNVGAAITAAILTHAVATANAWSPTWTVIGEVVVLTFIILIVSEITPKLIATRHPLDFARKMSGPLLLFHRVLYPLSVALARSMQAFHGRFKDSNGKISADDLKAMAEIGQAHGTIEEEERELIHSIVEFGETSVREIMVSRLDVVALHAGATIEEAVQVIRESGHSRLPLYVEHLDNILGIVYAKDLLRHMTEHPEAKRIDWTRLARPPMFVPLGKMLDDLLTDFQKRRTHIAVAVDEYGGTAGLVTLEDVLEEIVGEIRDEHDNSEEELYERISETEYLFDARIDLDDLNEVCDAKLDTEDFDFETLGGLVLNVAGEIPEQGSVFFHDGLRLDVEEVDNNRVLKVRVTVRPVTSELESRGPEDPD